MDNDFGSTAPAGLAQIRAHAAALAEALPSAPSDGPTDGVRSNFAERMRQAVHSVNQADHDAAQRMAAVDSGQSDDLVGAMLASQQASLSFSMLMQVRNKVMTAVEDLVKLPI